MEIIKPEKCRSCKQNIELVAEHHEEHGHNIYCEWRLDLVQDDTLCEDCKDDILEDLFER